MNSFPAQAGSGLDPVDLTDPASFAEGPPHAFLARLRASAPIWWHPDGLRRSGFWVVTRYDDVRAILLQPTVFVNAKGITIEPGEPAGLGDSETERGQGALSYTDPPQHGPLRKVLAQHFTPSRIRALGPLVRDHAERLVQRLADARRRRLRHRGGRPLPAAGAGRRARTAGRDRGGAASIRRVAR